MSKAFVHPIFFSFFFLFLLIMAADDGFGIGMGWDGVEFFFFPSFFS